MGITLFAFVYGKVPFYDDNILALYAKIRNQTVLFPETPLVSDNLKALITKMLIKDPNKRITLPEIKGDLWVTKDNTYPLPNEEENCHLVEITEEDVARVVTSIPKLDTLILIKHMLRKHSFQNPFSHRKEVHRSSNVDVTTSTTSTTTRIHLSHSGRSNSAPGSYYWSIDRQISIETPLESVTEVIDVQDNNLKIDETDTTMEKR